MYLEAQRRGALDGHYFWSAAPFQTVQQAGRRLRVRAAVCMVYGSLTGEYIEVRKIRLLDTREKGSLTLRLLSIRPRGNK